MKKVLFIGGTGIISTECSKLAIKNGVELFHLNRGISNKIRSVEGVNTLTADIRSDSQKVKDLIKDNHFDAVVDWVAFVEDHIKQDIEIFSGKCNQFVFISSASAYETPPQSMPVTEKTQLNNPFWQYSKDKISCENILKQEHSKNGFPYTIIRPSHTYDKTLFPFEGGYTVFNRIKNEKPIVIHGDGSSIWTLTHSKDFAKGLVGILGEKEAVGEDFHITSDHWISWFQIYKTFADLLNVELKPVFVPSNIIAKYDKNMGDSLLGDKTHSMIFDNSKIKSFVKDFSCTTTLKDGAKEIINWYESNPEHCVIDNNLNALFDTIIRDYSK